MPTVILIAAYTSQKRIIGKNGLIPWKIPEEMNHFKETTMGGAVIFGRKTFEGIGKALPGRFNVVISKTKTFTGDSLATAQSLSEAVQLCKKKGVEKIFICGGESVYREALEEKLPDELILSEVKEEFCGDLNGADAFFPEVPECYSETKKTDCGKFCIVQFTQKDYQR